MKNCKKIIAFLMILMIINVMHPSKSIYAASVPELPVNQETYFLTKTPTTYLMPLINVSQTSQIKNFKNTRSSVAAAKIVKQNGNICLQVTPKKTGNAILTFGVKYGNKTAKLSYKIKVVKYKNPLAKFTIGGKNYASRFKTDFCAHINLKASKQKISVKPDSGWKLLELQIYKGTNRTTVKNNSKVTLKKGSTIYIAMQHTKSGNILSCHAFLN